MNLASNITLYHLSYASPCPPAIAIFVACPTHPLFLPCSEQFNLIRLNTIQRLRARAYHPHSAEPDQGRNRNRSRNSLTQCLKQPRPQPPSHPATQHIIHSHLIMRELPNLKGKRTGTSHIHRDVPACNSAMLVRRGCTLNSIAFIRFGSCNYTCNCKCMSRHSCCGGSWCG